MNFIEQLERELTARGVRPAVRRRIVLEYADHIASAAESAAAGLGHGSAPFNPGDPAELAGQFAAELAADDARRTTRNTFLALAAAAAALVLGQLAIGAAGGYPGPGDGRSLALWIPAILAVLYTINFSAELAGWWVWTQAAAAAAAGLSLGPAIRGSVRCRVTVGGMAGQPENLFDLVVTRFEAYWPLRGLRTLRAPRGLRALRAPRGLRALRTRPWSASAWAAAVVVVGTTLFTAHAERSLLEGVERGGCEAIFIAAGAAVVRGRVRFRARRGPGPGPVGV